MGTLIADDKVFFRRELMQFFGVSDETLRRWQNNGKLPAPDICISNKTKGWKVSTLRKAGINL